MNTIKNKLHSKSGASLLLALLFLGFCVLIGGTVLAAASANGFRVTRMQAKQKELDDRNAAMLVADQLGDCGMNITIDKVANTVNVEVITYPMTSMQNVVSEMAVWQFLKVNDAKDAALTLTNFKYTTGTSVYSSFSKSSFMYQYNLNSSEPFTGTIRLAGDSVSRNVTFEMDEKYTLTVNLGADSLFRVRLKGQLTCLEDRGTLQSYKLEWGSPQILKEGA